MQDMFKVYLNFGEDSDCSWSILYVVLGAVCGVLLFLGTLWGMVHLCYTFCIKREASTKPTTYKLIGDTDDIPPCKYLVALSLVICQLLNVIITKLKMWYTFFVSEIIFEGILNTWEIFLIFSCIEESELFW